MRWLLHPYATLYELVEDFTTALVADVILAFDQGESFVLTKVPHCGPTRGGVLDSGYWCSDTQRGPEAA